MANNNNKNVTLDQLTTMDTTIKNYIQGKDGDLVGLLTVDKSNLANAIKETNNDLEDVDTTATAIDTTVDGMMGGTTVAVNLVEGEDTVEINGENLACKTYAISQNNTPIATINVPIDLTIEEGVVVSETDDNTGETTTYLKFKTTGASDYNLSLDVSSLVSGFSVQQDGILTLESGEITGEIVDGSVENSSIIDGNITEEKLSLGLQEKIAKEVYAERDIDILDSEKDSLLALHKDKSMDVITSGTRTTLNDWIKEGVGGYYGDSEYPVAIKINNDTWVGVDKQNGEVIVKGVVTEEEAKSTTTVVPDWDSDNDWKPNRYTFPDINGDVCGAADLSSTNEYYPLSGQTYNYDEVLNSYGTNLTFSFYYLPAGFGGAENYIYVALLHKVGEMPVVISNATANGNTPYAFPEFSKEQVYHLAVAMLMCSVETVGSIPNQEDMVAKTIYTTGDGSYSYIDYATNAVAQTTDLNTAYFNITPSITTLVVGRTYKNYKSEDTTSYIGKNYQNSQIGENDQLENGYAVKLINEEDNSETLFKLTIPAEGSLKYPQGQYTLLSELLPTLMTYDGSETQGFSVIDLYFKYDSNGELVSATYSEYWDSSERKNIDSYDLYDKIPQGAIHEFDNPYAFVDDISENKSAFCFNRPTDNRYNVDDKPYTPDPYWQRVSATDTSSNKMTVAEEIEKGIGDIPLAQADRIEDGTTVLGNNGLMPKEDVVALDGTYIDTVNNKLYIKGQEVMLNSTASDEDVDDIIDNFLGTRKIPITDELTAGEGKCYAPCDEEEDGVIGVRITEDNKASFIDSSFYTLVGDNHDETDVLVPSEGFNTMQQFLYFQNDSVTLAKKIDVVQGEDKARADHAYYTRAYYQDDKQDVKVTQKNYDKMFYTKQAHKKVQNNWTDLYGQEVVLNSTDGVDTVKTLLNNANDEGLFDASYSEEEFNKQRAFDETANSTSTGEQVVVADFNTSALEGYVAYTQATGTYVGGTTYYTLVDSPYPTAIEVDTTGFIEGETDVSNYYVSSKHNFFAKNKIIRVDGDPSNIQVFSDWMGNKNGGRINLMSIQPGGVAYIQNDLVGLTTFAKLQKQHTAANYNSFTKENFDKVLGRTIVLDQPINGTYIQATGTYVSGTIYYTNYRGTEEVDTSTFVEGVTDVSNYYIKVNTYPRYIVYAYNIIRDNTQANAPLNAQEKVPNDILEYVRASSHIQKHLLDENNQSNYGSIAFTTFEAAKRYLEYNGRIPSSETTIAAPNWSRLPGVVHISTVKFIDEEDEFTTIDDTPNHYVSLRNLKKLLLNKNVEYVKVRFNAGVVNHDPACWGNPPELEAEDALKTRTIDTSDEARAVVVTAENLWEFRGKRFSFEIPKLPDGSRAQTSNGNATLEKYNTLNPYNYVYWDGEPREEDRDIYTEDFRNAYRGVYSSDIGRTVWVDKGQLTI